MNTDIFFSALFLGNSGSGVTSILRKKTLNLFNEEHIQSLGPTIFYLDQQTENGKVHVSIWDYADPFNNPIHGIRFRKVRHYFIVLDVTDSTAIESIPHWIEVAKGFPNEGVQMFSLIVNKIDLDPSEWKIPKHSFESYAENNGIKLYFCSAKTGENLESLFQDIIQSAIIHGDKIQASN